MIKNRKGQIGIIMAVIFVAVILGGSILYVGTKGSGVGSGDEGGLGTSGQNPSVGLSFTDALTGASITAIADNYLDVTDSVLLGKSPTFVSGQKIKPLMNATNYIAQIQPDYTVVDGNQQIRGKLYRFGNATFSLKSNAGTGAIGGTLGSVGNDTAGTSQFNHEIKVTQSADRSSGRQFVIFELSNTTSVSSLGLSGVAGIVDKDVPNCFTSNLTSANPYQDAWEIPAFVDDSVLEYLNLKISPASSKAISGQATLHIYSEKDGVDTLTGKYLESGICDSDNQFFNEDKQTISWFYN